MRSYFMVTGVEGETLTIPRNRVYYLRATPNGTDVLLIGAGATITTIHATEAIKTVSRRLR
jgi:hypothetical protein